MNMHVHSRLPRRLADIYPDVVSVGRVLGVNQFLRPAKKVDNRELLLGRHFEEVGHMTLRNYEDVARTQGVAVQAHIRQFILRQDGVGGTELAFFALFHRSPFVLTND